MKNIIKKTPPSDLEAALMSYRKTPINASTPSPHHLMFHQSNEQNARQHENLLLKQDTTMKRESTGRRKVESTLKKTISTSGTLSNTHGVQPLLPTI